MIVRTKSRAAVLVSALAIATVTTACSGSGSGSHRSAGRATTTTTTAPSISTTAVPAGQNWPTYYGDAARTGTSSAGPVSPRAARRQWSSPMLDGDIYAQPLIAGNRVIVATENDTVYSLRASDGTIEWQRHLGEPVPGSSLPCGNVDPVGITSTPVVDPATARVYVVGMEEPSRHTMWVLDLASGRVIDSTRVDADGSDPTVQNQRAALTLANGRVYVPYGGRYGDCGDYRGRVVSVALTTGGLGNVNSFTVPSRGEAGLWTPPGASVAADGSLYLSSGNSTSRGDFDYGNAVIHLSPDLELLDAFAPRNWESLNAADIDLGSTGPVLLPNARVFQVGKNGIGYLLDANHLSGVGGELSSTHVCSNSAFGAVAHQDDTLFVPCINGIARVTVRGNSLSVDSTTRLDTPGPALVTPRAVWTVATGSGDLVALDPASGEVMLREHLGSVPSRFTSLAAAGGRVVVGADRMLFAYGA